MVTVEGYEIPEDLYYTNDHTYARVEKDGSVTAGMDAYGVKAAGDIEFIDLPREGEKFTAGEAFGSLESKKWVGGLVMPVGGAVIAVNRQVEDDFDLLKNDPYGEGWLIRIMPDNPGDELKRLVHGTQVEGWFREDLKKRQSH